MSLEDRFKSFAREQEESVRQYYEAYENKVRTLNSVDAMVSKVLSAFCDAVGWSLRRNDVCDRTGGRVANYYHLQHERYYKAEGFVEVRVEIDEAESVPINRVTVFRSGSDKPHSVIPLGELTEETLATALEQESAQIVRSIKLHERLKD